MFHSFFGGVEVAIIHDCLDNEKVDNCQIAVSNIQLTLQEVHPEIH